MKKLKVEQVGDNAYKIESKVKVSTEDGEKVRITVNYFVTENADGSIYVHVPDAKPSEKSDIKNHDGLEFTVKPEDPTLIPIADAASGTKKFTMEFSKTIHNNFVDGNEKFVQNCYMTTPSTTASMYGAADATTIGKYWRAINVNVLGALIYMDWCIWSNTHEGTEFEMGGSSYSDDHWTTSRGHVGWGPTGGLQFPWDDLHFKAHVYYD